VSYSIVFLGTSSASRGTGLARIGFDLESGAATVPELATEVADPALFVLSRNGARLYCATRAGSAPTPSTPCGERSAS
jgi:6-phosphogluconolactonase (cycloisomerase 2 family)